MTSEERDLYGDDKIESKDAKIDNWLKFFYIVLPIWGFISFFIFWNGSTGWADRGYWQQLQRAANTTFPKINFNDLPPPDEAGKKGPQKNP